MIMRDGWLFAQELGSWLTAHTNAMDELATRCTT